MTTPAVRVILETEGNKPNIDLSRLFLDGGDHANIMDWAHVYIHEAKRYFAGAYDAALGAGSSIELAITVGQTMEAHAVADVGIGVNATLQIFEGTTLDSNPGTLVTPCNRFRGWASNPDISSMSVYSAPNVGDAGVQIGPTRFIPGGSNPAQASGGMSRSDELILEVGETYLYRFTNITVGAAPASILLDWYEHLPIIIG